ncbi:MAG: indolepyruvate ferredoxin oxidoreductase subunit alpha [Desulfobacteraceae bacterium]|nr:MAG: indolepyruvate ferredoxin oxidoreductase subunit alpha [Desulfobacteraceae bacterium]
MGRLYYNVNEPGKACILSGNEAVARGALEAGVGVVSSYPGSPSVQIMECLAAVSRERNLYAEWSINEKVALEVAAAGSFSGLRSLCIMKADGLNVAMDFLTTLPLSGIGAGLVLVVSDDPGVHSSVKEEDTRYLAPAAHVPVIEPSNPQEALRMTRWAFEVSEETGLPLMVRLVTRICHARATVVPGKVTQRDAKPLIADDARFITAARFHPVSHRRLDKAKEIFEESAFNHYEGPDEASLAVIASGVSYQYSLEALELLDLERDVGIFQVGTIWPLPEKKVLSVLRRFRTVLFLEEIETFLEDQVRVLASGHMQELSGLRLCGKRSGDVPWVMKSRGMGEMDPDIAIEAIAGFAGRETPGRIASGRFKVSENQEQQLPVRLPSLCAGCPHRASYWAIKKALTLDGRGGFALGDIGCYALGVLPTGYETIRTVHSMGSGVGVAGGLGNLRAMGLRQPVVAVIGDSTFFHAGIPPLINAKTNGSQYLCVILDNETTAMTGHQPHPGSGVTAVGEPAASVPIHEVLKGLDIPFTVADPYMIGETVESILALLRKDGLNVLILRRQCALKAGRRSGGARVYVDEEKCLGDLCGCDRYCSRIFSCPANVWDEEKAKARIDEVICVGCGVCAEICPGGAIIVEKEG